MAASLCAMHSPFANNIQEPFRTLSLNAIDASIKWWHGKPAPRASALRAPWSLTPNLQQHLKKFLRQWHFQMLEHQVPCHTPSFKMVFIKHAAVLDQLCNHKKAIDDWSTSNPAVCCCQHWSLYKTAALNPSDPHWVLSGSLLHSVLPPELAVIAEGSLSNKVFPSRKEYQNQMRLGMKTWTKKNGLPSMPNSNISDLCHHLWSEHTQQITNHITKSSITQLQSTFDGAVIHCEDKHSSSLRIYCPCLYYQAIEQTFQDPSIFEQLPDKPESIVSSLVESLQRQHGKAYPWAVGSGRQLPTGYILAKRKKDFRSGRPIISFVDSPFRPMLNILARLIFQLIPAACPDHFATGDVYTLLFILKSAPVDADLIRTGQSRLSRLLHQHRPRQICQILVHAFGLPTAKNERLRQWSFLGLPGQIQQPRRHHQRTHLSSSQRHSENHHQRRPRSHKISTEYADFRTGPKVRPSMPRKSNGQPSFACIMSDGRLHQWTNLVHYLQSTSLQPPPFHPSHPICRQPSHLWWQTPHCTCTIWSPPGWWFLRKTHHSRNWTWSGISWLHARNQTIGTDISRTDKCVPSPFTIFSFS